MEKVTFVDPETKEEIQFFVVEETQINGTRYLFVTEEEDGDCDAYILKEVAAEKEDVFYEMVEDDTELAAVGKIFAELVEDAEVRF
ncbi:MAG: DUF1292 domain-containing protein [Clostridiales bacterium]|nr:DUF1292 domain-containing protein [Clostridiales bacterium]